MSRRPTDRPIQGVHALFTDPGHSEIDKLLDEVRRLDGPSQPRKHHLVPASYLNRWAINGKIQATDIRTRSRFVTAPKKAARETDFYRMESHDLDPAVSPPLTFEKILSLVEGAAVSAFDEAIRNGVVAPDGPERINLCRFVSYQHVRGHRFRNMLQSITDDTTRLEYSDLTVDQVRQRLGGNPSGHDLANAMDAVAKLKTGELRFREQQASLVAQIGEFAELTMSGLVERDCRVIHTDAELVLTDEPVLLLGGPGWPRGQVPGSIVARIIVMPLSPHHLLVMVSPDHFDMGQFDDRLSVTETEEINTELLAHAYRWQFTTTRQTGLLHPMPPPAPPTVLERGLALADRPGEVVRSFTPNRWLYAGDVPWPVKRWWSGLENFEAFPSAWRGSPGSPSQGLRVEGT
jgi:hypothetical protein